MKKLLGSTLVAALLVPAVANAELLKNFKMSGSLETDAVSATNITDFKTSKYDDIGTVQARAMVHADWDVLDDVHAHVSIHNNYNFGSNVEAKSATALDEAYVKVDKLFGGLDTTIGRQSYGEPGDLVIYFGPKYDLYGMPVTALDAGRFDVNGDKGGMTLLAAKVVGGVVGSSNTGNVDIYGIDLHVRPADNTALSAYLYNRTTINSGTGPLGVVGNDYLYLAGLKAKVSAAGSWVKAEFDKNFGANRTVPGNNRGVYGTTANYTGWEGKLDLGVKAGPVTLWGQGGVGSGGTTVGQTFQAIAGDYRPGSIYGRFAANSNSLSSLGSASPSGSLDNGSLGNRVIIGAGLKVNPVSKLTTGFSWWSFRPGNSLSRVMLGNEYDLDFTWAHSENVTLSAGVGDFQPGNAIDANNGPGGTSPARLGFADVAFKF
jgi:hypothetical protein